MFMKPWWIHIAQKTACNRLGTACTCTACTIWITLQNYSTVYNCSKNELLECKSNMYETYMLESTK